MLTARTVMTCLALSLAGTTTLADESTAFSRDVLPLLSDRCFHCHGPDPTQREADLRLDDRASAIADRGGYAAIVPGDPDASEILLRITSDDDDLRMPPADSHRKPLTDAEVTTIRKWIADGAVWGRHWSFQPPQQASPPDPERHPIDAFVRRKLAEHDLSPAPRAARTTLARRLAFDLTGLPPTPDDLADFLADDSPDAVGRFADRLMNSPHYGERMAMWWLDAARYSDTDGYQQDATRTNWPWRDWVVDAFNSNQPFDAFTIAQFAGDLLPDASAEQILATCFHRNHMTNGEGGRDPEESRVDYVIDRVNTTGTVWLGLTLGCCQCHAHKFDPISQRDYYSLSAFFNSIDEDGRAGGGARPFLTYRSPRAQRAVDDAQAVVDRRSAVAARVRERAEDEFEPWLAKRLQEVRGGFEPWQPLIPSSLRSVEGTRLVADDDGTVQAGGPRLRQDDYILVATSPLPRVTGLRLDVFPHASHTRGGWSAGGSGEFILTDVKLQVRRIGQSQVRDIELANAVASAEKSVKGRNYGRVRDTLDDDPRNGWTVALSQPAQPQTAVFELAEPLTLAADERLQFVMLHRSTEGDANIGRFRVSVTDQPGDAVRSLDPMPLEQLADAAPATASDVADALRDRLRQQFLAEHAAWQQADDDLRRAREQLATFRKAAQDLKVMVLAEREEPRTTFVLERGVWDNHGDEVQRSVPEAVLSWPADDTQSRLDLARWLVDRDNPLTARVIVNQLWQLCFGAGLVRTPEDFGLQGERPTHPELLDWLAVEFMDSGWNVRHILRLIVTSETWQQSSHLTEALRAADPDNRWLARGARFRLPSWMIRDAALRSSGLLNPAVGGPPVMPYQPDGVWAEMFMGRFQYRPSQGPAQFRRTLYAFWRRSAAPTFLFDSAQRRVCEVRPRRTNTPLQALTLLNDLTLLEASRHLAASTLAATDSESEQRQAVFRAILQRDPSPAESAVLAREHQRAIAFYASDPAAAEAFLDFGQPEHAVTSSIEKTAALTVVCSMIYNLDEAITRE